MKNTKLLFILISIFFVSQNVFADTIVKTKPKFIYKIDNLTYFDNRLFYLPYHQPMLFFGDRLTALGGLGLNKEGDHKLYAGLTANIFFGNNFKNYAFMPMVYYRFEKDFPRKQKKCIGCEHTLKLNFGILPYREMEMTFPGFIRRGSTEYTAPNLQGALLQYNFGVKLLLEYAVDWRKMKTHIQRDNYGMILAVTWKQFFVTDVSGGIATAKKLMDIGVIAQWDRLGHSDSIKNNVDNIVINPFVKADFAPLTKNFKTIFLQIGYLGSFSNDNIFINKKWNNSLLVDCGIQWKMITLKNSLYISLNQEKDGNLMPLHQYYPELYISDHYYRAPLYNKTELAFDLINIKSIFTLKAQFLMHYVPKSVFNDLPNKNDFKSFGWQQRITANVKF